MKLFLGICFGLILINYIVESKMCPDEKSRCSSSSTCCKTGGDTYGCCPYPNAVCCTDGRHCCPSGSQCDVAHSRCIQSTRYWFLGTKWANVESDEDNEISDIEHEIKKKPCPDGKQQCPDTWTCCPTATNGYACCPFQDGVCCADFTHCCEKGKKCNLNSRSCD